MKMRTNLKAWLTISVFLIGVGLVAQGVVVGDTFTVVNTDDSGTGSLREAIELANANPGLDLIAFNIPGSGPHTIQPLTAFPLITDRVTIDGYTQPGTIPANYSSPAKLLIELDGSNVSGTGLVIWLVGNSTVRGLVINHFGDVGIHIEDGGNNVIEGNYIGTDVTGTVALGNFDDGIRILDAPNNRIGGTTPAARNIISGNGDMGIEIQIPGSVGNTIQGNYIGTDATGTAALGNNDHGIFTGSARDSMIGPGNVISGNGGTGIELAGSNEAGNHQILGNLIGTDVSGTAALGNFCGVRLMGQNGNTVKDNTISDNDLVGIWLGDGDPDGLFSHNNTVSLNTVCSNGGFGIQIMYSNNNTIYNNSFIDNGLVHSGGDQAMDQGGTGNIFNLAKPIGGNYWSDWTGPDVDGDGFVDSPYEFYGGIDYLPWAYQDGWENGCLVQQLVAQVKELGLAQGIENSLEATLKAAARALDNHNVVAAINTLEAFIKQVEAQRGNKISDTDADALIAAAQQIIDLVGYW